jgi:hypothetical protein
VMRVEPSATDNAQLVVVKSRRKRRFGLIINNLLGTFV